jgi:hypothetical protein
MIVLSHRGYWERPEEKNTLVAFERSFAAGFGTETDVRDCAGTLVISHDPPRGGEMRFADFAALDGAAGLPQAINIKADGLAEWLAAAARDARLSDWFAFDMSVPDMRAHLRAGNPVFTRISEAEPMPAYLDEAAGVWLDGFSGMWFDLQMVRDLLGRGKRVCVVSSELHGREPRELWATLRSMAGQTGLMLCTDHPEAARAAFGT